MAQTARKDFRLNRKVAPTKLGLLGLLGLGLGISYVVLCTQRIKQNGADSKKRRFVNSIQECFYLNCSWVNKVIFFIKFSGTSPSDHYYIIHFLTTYRDVLSALGLVKKLFSQKFKFKKTIKNFNKIREFDPTLKILAKNGGYVPLM